MTKAGARKHIIDYLKRNDLHFHLLNDSNKPLVDINDLTIYLRFHVEDVPDHFVESSIWFYDEGLEVRGYYSKNSASWIKKIITIFRMLSK